MLEQKHTILNQIEDLFQIVKQGKRLTRLEADALSNLYGHSSEASETIVRLAESLKCHFLGSTVEFCSIINAKSGHCTEDCQFCAQSAHYSTEVEAYEFLNYETIASMAKENAAAGVHRSSLVTSGLGADEETLRDCLDAYRRLKTDVDIELCASLGILTYEALANLAAAGVTTYHHNVESSRNYYSKICSTHSYDDRVRTIRAAQAAGLEVCSGGIIGMGESEADRLDMIFELRDLCVLSIPINVLNPIPGTPLYGTESLSTDDILKTIALFRWIHPEADLRLAGGRSLLPKSGRDYFKSGISAAITGNYLTTSGQTIQEDFDMMASLNITPTLRIRNQYSSINFITVPETF